LHLEIFSFLQYLLASIIFEKYLVCDTEERRRSLNAKRTFENLFGLDFIPIVNENDTIATTEIKYGDNDRLASRVAQISAADSLILLSDVEGLYTNPKINKNAKLIKEIKNIDKNIEQISTKSVGEHGTGGMKTKIDAAKICQLSGCIMAIANGLPLRPIKKIIEKNNCTWFLHKVSKLDARKKWIISSISPKGQLITDEMRIQSKKKKWSKDVQSAFEKELKKLQRMNPSMSDYSVQRSYIE
jgi:glutamate 5-kinase